MMTSTTPEHVRQLLESLRGQEPDKVFIHGKQAIALCEAYLEAVEFIAIQRADRQALKITNLDKIGGSYSWKNLTETCKGEYREWAEKQLALTRMEGK